MGRRGWEGGDGKEGMGRRGWEGGDVSVKYERSTSYSSLPHLR